ncbi:MAG: DUF177 domain-containing protein [Alphaproteobacteria bacterium]|nr:DUF177 domain-containing protein [Alphaproteobacteria bacterium]
MAELQRPPEFSRVLEVEKIVQDDVDLVIDATSEECQRIADRLDILGVERLSAKLQIQAVADGPAIRVDGRFAAQVVQRCVVSLERLATEIDEPLMVQFGPPAEAETELEFNVDDADPPEPLVDDRIDFGELVVQHLAVALDPYPQKSGAQPPDWCDGVDTMENSRVDNPFSVLAALKKKQE